MSVIVRWNVNTEIYSQIKCRYWDLIFQLWSSHLLILRCDLSFVVRWNVNILRCTCYWPLLTCLRHLLLTVLCPDMWSISYLCLELVQKNTECVIRPEVTPCLWQDISKHELTESLTYLFVGWWLFFPGLINYLPISLVAILHTSQQRQGHIVAKSKSSTHKW